MDAAFDAVRCSREDELRPKSQRNGRHAGLLTFSGLLNALDGVAGQEGKIVVMTTNCLDTLDDALVRPGRVDLRARFHYASRSAVQGVFCNFYSAAGLVKSELLKASSLFAGNCAEAALPVAVIQAHLMQYRNDPWGAARSTPPAPQGDKAYQRKVKQFAIPVGAAVVSSCEEE